MARGARRAGAGRGARSSRPQFGRAMGLSGMWGVVFTLRIVRASAGGIIWTRASSRRSCTRSLPAATVRNMDRALLNSPGPSLEAASQLCSRGWQSTGCRRPAQQAVADRLGLSWDEIHRIQERAVRRGLGRRKAEPVRRHAFRQQGLLQIRQFVQVVVAENSSKSANRDTKRVMPQFPRPCRRGFLDNDPGVTLVAAHTE